MNLVLETVDNLVTGLPRWLSGKESACQCRRCRSSRFGPWVGKIPCRGNRNSLLYSCLKNPMDKRAWQTTVHGVTKRHTHTCCIFHSQLYFGSSFYLFSPTTWQGGISISIRMICFFSLYNERFSQPPLINNLFFSHYSIDTICNTYIYK